MDSSGTDGLTLVQEVILEFRAGKMFTEGTRVVPDTRRGLVRLIKGEVGLIHLQWLDRSQNMVEDDQIVFPDEAVFEKVEQSSGRVYILKFNTDNRKFFFWMQEPKSDGDARICSLVNYYINRPLDLQEDDAEASVPLQTSELSDDTGNEISSRDANMNTMKASAETADEVSSSGPVQLADLQRILSNFEPAGAALGLGDILKPDLLQPLIQTLPLDGQLASYLPEGKWTPDNLIELLQSPPFRQQVDSFTYVLQTGQIDLSQFGIDPSKYKFTVTSFLEALEDSVSKNSSSENAANSTPTVASDMQTDVKDLHPHQPNDDAMDESQ